MNSLLFLSNRDRLRALWRKLERAGFERGILTDEEWTFLKAEIEVPQTLTMNDK